MQSDYNDQNQPFIELSSEVDEAPEGSTQGLQSVLGMLRRRWKLASIMFLLVAVPAVGLVKSFMPPVFTATARVKVEPTDPDIDKTSLLPLWKVWLQTEVENVKSDAVLNQALADEIMADFPITDDPNALTELRKKLRVNNPHGTYLVEIAVTDQNRRQALALCKSVLTAYMRFSVQAREREHQEKIDVLTEEQKRLETEMRVLRDEIRGLAEAYNTTDAETFRALREQVIEELATVRQDRREHESRLMELERENKHISRAMELLKEGNLKAVLSEELLNQRADYVRNDAQVAFLQERVQQTARSLGRTRRVHGDEDPRVKELETLLAEQELELQKHEESLLEEKDFELTSTLIEKNQQRHRALKDRIADEQKSLQTMQELETQLEDRSSDMGRQHESIKDAQDRLEKKQAYSDRTDDQLRSLVRAGRLQARVRQASSPEILPGGVRDRRTKMSVVAVVGAMFFAVSIALMRDRLDSRLREPDQVTSSTGLPLLGAVPSIRDLRLGKATPEDFRESYRIIRTALDSLVADSASLKVILVTSAQAGEGKTSMAVSLASSLAEQGERVLLIDGDIQAPSIGRLLRLAPSKGHLKHALAAERTVEQCAIQTAVQRMEVITGGVNGESSRGVLDTRSARRLISEAMGAYDRIIVDSPPVLGAADSLVWASVSDGVLLATLADGSTRKAVKLACQRLRSIGANLLGAVVANVSLDNAYYSYSTTSVTDSDLLESAQAGHSHRHAVLPLLADGGDDVSSSDKRG